jgi:hypothetical protein
MARSCSAQKKGVTNLSRSVQHPHLALGQPLVLLAPFEVLDGGFDLEQVSTLDQLDVLLVAP